MNSPSIAAPEPSSNPNGDPPAKAAPAATRPLYWSVRRELWENRSVYIAPLAVAAFALLASVIGALCMPARMRVMPGLDPAARHAALVRPYGMAQAAIVFAAALVGIFYSLDALHGERRDRSILFWKSLPVSDLTAVLAKASIPLVVLPLLAVAIGAATQLGMMLLALLGSGAGAPALWAELPVFQMPLLLLYGIVTLALWHAPLYGWLLLVSAWARRTPVLWAVLPPLAVCVVEKLALNTTYFAALLGRRLLGSHRLAFDVGPLSDSRYVIVDRLAQATPARFLAAPGLWLGLAVAAACLAAAARLRRLREPI
jgi:ABC-2 type transport system permease protein